MCRRLRLGLRRRRGKMGQGWRVGDLGGQPSPFRRRFHGLGGKGGRGSLAGRGGLSGFLPLAQKAEGERRRRRGNARGSVDGVWEAHGEQKGGKGRKGKKGGRRIGTAQKGEGESERGREGERERPNWPRYLRRARRGEAAAAGGGRESGRDGLGSEMRVAGKSVPFGAARRVPCSAQRASVQYAIHNTGMDSTVVSYFVESRRQVRLC